MPDMPNIMLAELNHRVANSFQMVGALLNQQAREGPVGAEALERAAAQINAFALLHRLLEPVQEGLGTVDGRSYLEALCRQLVRACMAPRGLELVVEIAPGPFYPRTCQHLGLVITELVVNAAKHAFVDRGQGRVQVFLARADGECVLVVTDDGCGFEFGQSSVRGLSLVQQLARSLKGEIGCQSSPTGTRFAIHFPDELACKSPSGTPGE